MSPGGSQISLGIVRGISDSSHIAAELNRASSQVTGEPQGSSAFLTLIAWSLQSWNRRVRPRFVLRNRTPLASGVDPGVTGHLSSCI